VLINDRYYSKGHHRQVRRVMPNEGKACEILGSLYQPMPTGK
jgi:hypothetical protein